MQVERTVIESILGAMRRRDVPTSRRWVNKDRSQQAATSRRLNTLIPVDRYPYPMYTMLLDTTRAVAHIGVHIYTPCFLPIKFLAPLSGTKFSVILRTKQLDITLEFLFYLFL